MELQQNSGSTDINKNPHDFIIDIGGFDKKYIWKRHPAVCIYRVPRFLIDLNENAYVPQMVGLGPYHHRNEQFAYMEEHKVEAVRRMLGRIKIDIALVIEEVKKLEIECRRCYEEELDKSWEDSGALAWMFILDGCFILECCRNYKPTYDRDRKEEVEKQKGVFFEPIFNPNRLDFNQGYAIFADIMKIENQIPMVILKKLVELEEGSKEKAEDRLCNLLYKVVIEASNPFEFLGSNRLPESVFQCATHLVDLLNRIMTCTLLFDTVYFGNESSLIDRCKRCIRSCWPEKLTKTSSSRPQMGTMSSCRSVAIPPATVLESAGIKVKWTRSPDDSRPGTSKIKFKKHILSSDILLPRLTLTDNKETVLRNQIAYEECRALDKNVVTRYALLIDDLINSKEDVALLRREKIIDNVMGSDAQVVDLINGLCKGLTRRYIVAIDEEVVEEVKDHYDRILKVLVGEFMQEHCSKPWYVVAMVAATLALVMTMVQTYTTVKGG